MARLARKRHLRHSDYDRTARSTRLRAFLNARSTALEATGSTYEFTVDAAQGASYASGLLTFAGQPTAADTVTVGALTLTYVDAEPAANDVLIGADVAATIANTITALGASTEVEAEAGSGDDIAVTALEAGADGNAIATTATSATLSWADATLTGGSDASEGSAEVTIAAHGLSAGDGPLAATSTDELPEGMHEGEFFWVASVVDANTVTLSTKRGDRIEFQAASAGSGTHELIKADDPSAIYEYLRQNEPEVVRDAEDVDDL